MSQLTSMYQAVEFIEVNLRQPVAVTDIARAVSYSLYHFCRVFNQVVRHSPYDYLMRRRLSESARDLVETNKTITEIAFDYQFNSLETYSRAFKRMFELQPNQWKKQGQIDERFLMSPLTLAYLKHINQGDSLKPVLAQKKAFYVAGVMTLFKEDDPEEMAKLWEFLGQALAGLANLTTPQRYYGIGWYPEGWLNHGFFYMAGIEIESPDIDETPLVIKKIPSGQYARFIHQGPAGNRNLTLAYIYHTWLPKSGRRLACNLEIETYGPGFPRFDQSKSERKIYIPLL
ncbi:MAG: AraC family transcriptional regulator [Anaerolineae bacterium]|nr:AraC family transcriptional regulator [Anaerolineae bacterium]